LLAAASVLAVAATCLSACQSHVGAAAFVGHQRIAESDVNKYVTANAAAYSASDPNTGAATTVNPKSQVLTLLVRNELFTDLFKTLPGGLPSAGALAKARTAAIAQLGEPLEQFTLGFTSHGYRTSFVNLELDYEATITVLLDQLKDPGDGSVLIPKLEKLHLNVSISPRYGAWEPQQYGVSDGPTALPFLKLASTADSASAAGGSA
jgi:hypothetical protein